MVCRGKSGVQTPVYKRFSFEMNPRSPFLIAKSLVSSGKSKLWTADPVYQKPIRRKLLHDLIVTIRRSISSSCFRHAARTRPLGLLGRPSALSFVPWRLLRIQLPYWHTHNCFTILTESVTWINDAIPSCRVTDRRILIYFFYSSSTVPATGKN